MSKELRYMRPHRLDALQDQLWAAGIRPERVTSLGDAITIVVPDGADMATVQAVVDAHDPRALDAATTQRAQQQAQTRAAILATAQGAVGKQLSALTTAERAALATVLLWRIGAVAADGAIRPLDAWADGPARG